MSSMVLDGVSPRSRSMDPVTSVDAGRAAKLHASQAAVLDFLSYGGEYTQADIEWAYRNEMWSPSRIRSAVSELVDRGLVEWTGETRSTRYGRQARVYRAVVPSE